MLIDIRSNSGAKTVRAQAGALAAHLIRDADPIMAAHFVVCLNQAMRKHLQEQRDYIDSVLKVTIEKGL